MFQSPASDSSSSTSSTSSIHHASLVDPATHSPALLELIDVKVSRQVIDYVVDRVVETVDYAMGRPTPSSSRGRAPARRPEHAKFTTFVENVLTRAEVTMSTVLATLVYIDRSKPHLHIGLEQWALERVFLGALIVASKYLNDSTLKNVHWALCTGVFGKRDVGRIEREYLDVLNFELKVTEDDLLSHHHGLAAVVAELAHAPAALASTSAHSARRHTRRRDTLSAPAPAPVPELSPPSASSESDSDSAFSSPRTPSESSSLGTSPAEAPARTKAAYPLPTRARANPHPHATGARKMMHAACASTMEVLGLPFPIPRMATS